MGAILWAMGSAVDRGLLRNWSDLARLLWVSGIVFGIIAFVLSLAGAWDLLPTQGSHGRARTRDTGRELTTRVFVLVYGGSLVIGTASAFAVQSAWGISPYRVMVAEGSLLFLGASLGRPWWLYETIRRLGWFGLIESDRAMRLVLLVLGLGLLTAAILAPDASFERTAA